MNKTIKPKEKSILLAIVFFFSLTAFGQNWQWARSGGGNQSDKSTDMDIDSNGTNIFICGYFNQQATFGSINPVGGFGKQGLLAKLDSAGNWLWVLEGDGGWDERVLGMCTDKVNGFVYITGTTWTSYLTFGTGCPYSSLGTADEIFVGKYDYNGNCQWLIGAGGNSDDHGFDLVTDPAGNIYLTGMVSNEYSYNPETATFGTLQTPAMNFEDSLAFVAKISPAGVFQWVKTFAAVDGERDNRIAIDANNNVYVTGGYWGTKQFGTVTATSNGGVDIFVIKFDSNGNQQWLKTTGSTLDDRGNSITVDIYGDVYITGEFRDKVAFGTDTINNNGGAGGRDIFVAKITQAGNWIWAKKAGSSSGSERGNRIVGNNNGNLFVTGEMNDTAKFGGNIILNNAKGVQVFVACIDTSGKWQWAKQAGSPGEDRGNGLIADQYCNVYVDGYYVQTATFDSSSLSLSAVASKDIFVAKIKSACPDSTPPVPQADCPPPVFPNVFTPNGDGVNDYFFVNPLCLEKLELNIYNRWGTLIAKISSPAEKWDGNSKGKPASDGVYYYVGSSVSKDGKTQEVKGYVTLAR